MSGFIGHAGHAPPAAPPQVTKYFGPEAHAFRRGEEGPLSVRLKWFCIRCLLWHDIGMRTDVPFESNHNIIYSCRYHRRQPNSGLRSWNWRSSLTTHICGAK